MSLIAGGARQIIEEQPRIRTSKTTMQMNLARMRTSRVDEEQARAIMENFNDELSLMSIPR